MPVSGAIAAWWRAYGKTFRKVLTSVEISENPPPGYRSIMKTLFRQFVRDEQGQDLIEYTLLLAFVALASAALFIGAGTSINSIWTTANTQLSNAASSAS